MNNAPSKKAFVLMPFHDPYDSYYPAIFKPSLESLGYIVTRGDDIFKPGIIMRDIVRSIHDADLVLCEMSGRNPNVFYELGLAHAAGKPVILVSVKEGDIPFDLRHLRVILYNSKRAGWEEKLRQDIKQAAEAVEVSHEVGGFVKEPVADEIGPHLSRHDVRSVWEQGYTSLSLRYGWGYDDLSVVGTIDPEGAITIERQITVTARSLLTKLEQSLNVRPAEHKIETLTRDHLDVFSLTPGITVTLGNIYPFSDGWVIEVVFDPYVPPGGTVTFTLRERLPADTYAVGYTQDRLREDDIRDQWFGWHLDRPTLHFKARVQIPRGYKPSGYVHRVFFTPLPKDITNARRHSDEELRLERLLKLNSQADEFGEHYTLDLQVHLPILGLLYIIRWDPLACG